MQTYKDLIHRIHSPELKDMLKVHTVPEAMQVYAFGADALVIQRGDAGGHGRQGVSPSFTVMIPELGDKSPANYPLLAAGGIVDGKGLAAALAAGADVVVSGTRFVVCPECDAPEEHKAKLIEATRHSTSVISESWDQFSGFLWPERTHARALKNDIYYQHHVPVGSKQYVPTQEEKYTYRSSVNDFNMRAAWAGAGVEMVKDRCAATEVLITITDEARTCLQSAQTRIA